MTKTEAVKTDTANSENKTADNSVSKKETAPKSASQSSISHFSSVSTPDYRSGWDNIFGEKSNSKEITKSDLPKRFNLFDYDVDLELRAALDKTLTDVAEKRGFDLTRNKETTRYEYSITCEIKKT